ncbi:hypothetical protein ACSVH2_09305 [Flavobacterium sp. RSB2_4_14]|uniref:hypothetical protein n=1 Tax=Flavobacterium sp. RSB2_4_14 TaxID=3447665 RepID=UPI003F2A6296
MVEITINKKLLFGLLMFSLTCLNTSAQVKNSGNDSTKVYKDIKKYSKKNKFNESVYKLLFKSKRKSKPTATDKRKKYFIKKSFDRGEGKIIRNINIETLDPFGYAVDNYSDKPEKGVEKFGNSIHFKTRKWTIRNLLLFKKNEALDSLIAKESERLIRKQRYVRSVIINPVEIPNSKDSIDISVRVLDSWSLVPDFTISSSQTSYGITEKNFMGLGHEFKNDFVNRFDNGDNAYLGKYSISNIKNTYINATFLYENSLKNNTRKSARVERTFFSPLTRLAGGVFFENRFYVDSLPNTDEIFEDQHFKLETQEYWLGHSFKVFKGKDIDFRATNLVTTIGYKNVKYLETPTEEYDPSHFFSSEKLYLTSIGINTRKYAQDKYLFNFGIVEDVPYGQVYSITAGFQDKNYEKRAYFGGRFAYGDYFSFGYLSLNSEWGSFYSNGCTEETTFRFEMNYFSNLLKFGKWKIRQFIKPTLVLGNHRAPIIKDRLLLTDSNGLSGFENPLVNGIKKITASFQTQTYVPGNWHGFHFSPFYNMTFGLLGDETNEFINERLYSKFSLGVLINNDYLVFDNFQISISYYPSIPFEGTNIFKTNSLKNDDIALPDFEIGQPIIVPYK